MDYHLGALLLVLVIPWVALPFLVFGINRLLREALEQLTAIRSW